MAVLLLCCLYTFFTAPCVSLSLEENVSAPARRTIKMGVSSLQGVRKPRKTSASSTTSHVSTQTRKEEVERDDQVIQLDATLTHMLWLASKLHNQVDATTQTGELSYEDISWCGMMPECLSWLSISVRSDFSTDTCALSDCSWQSSCCTCRLCTSGVRVKTSCAELDEVLMYMLWLASELC